MTLHRLAAGVAAVVALAGVPARADVGDPRVGTDHPWYSGELDCSTFERLFAHQAEHYGRVTGVTPGTEDGRQDLFGKGKWVLLDHDISTVIFGAKGTRLLSIPEINADLSLAHRRYLPQRQRGWLVSGLHPTDAPGVYTRYDSAAYLPGYTGLPPAVVTFDWTDDTGPHRQAHVFHLGDSAAWKFPTGRNVRTRRVEFEPVDEPPAPGTRGNAHNVPYIGRRTPDGHPVRLARATGHVSNYTEAKVRPYKLPDPLVTSAGRRVTTAELWEKERRPEILKFFQTDIYGRVPDNAPKVTWEVAETAAGARDGAANLKRVVGKIGDKPGGPRMNLTLFTPAKAEKPVPVLLSLTFSFGPRKAPARPAGAFDPVAEVLSRGWAYASVGYTDIQPDRPDRWTEGVIGLTLKKGQARPAPDEWGTISAWAWGVSRCLDYFETDKAIDARRVAITGASRLGKTVLWAGAQDRRVAAVFAVVPGELGASLIRRDWGETLDDMAQNFPWQFAGNLQKWVGKWDDLPVDQHLLIALCAPRPVYVNGGLNDQWSDPKGEFLALVAAGPVYRLLGAKDLGVTEVPPLDKPVTSGSLAFHYHSAGHTAVPADWKAFLDFADRHFKAPPAKRP
jgi:hypothetical protein